MLHFSWLFVNSFPNYLNQWVGVSMILAASLCSWQTVHDLSPDYTFNEIYMRYMLLASSHNVAMVYKNSYSKTVPNHVRMVTHRIQLDV